MDLDKRCEMACEILRTTNDGDDLAPEHLKLVELAVNGFLSEKGETKFYQLYDRVKAGYKKPWLQGVENITIDHTGYIYWKGYRVEHYTLKFAYSPKAKKDLKELVKRCELLEKHNLPVNSGNVVWNWEKVSAELHRN